MQASYNLSPGTGGGSYTIAATYSDIGGNYMSNVTDSSHTLTINAATSQTTVSNASVTYRNTAQPVVLTAHVQSGTTNVASGEGVVVFKILDSSSTVVGTTNSVAIGTGGIASTTYSLLPTVPVGTYTIEADYSDPADYGSSFNDGTLTVGVSSQTITFTGAPTSAAYNQTFLVSPTSTSGLPITLSGTNCTIVAVSGGFDVTMNVGSVTATLTASQAGNGNYTAAMPVTQTIAATKATANVSLSGLVATYNGSAQFASAATTPSGIAVNLVYQQGSTLISSPTAAGTYSVTATINDPNYQGSNTGMFVIDKVLAMVAFDPTSLTQTYDGTVKTLSANTSPAGLSLLYSFSEGGIATSPVNAGSYTVTAIVNDANYQGSGTTTLTIDPAALTVVADDETMTYDGKGFPAFTAHETGFLHGDTASVISGAPVFGGSAASAVNAGSYAIVPSLGSLSAVNYAFTGFADATLTIDKAPLTVVADDQAMNFDARDVPGLHSP